MSKMLVIIRTSHPTEVLKQITLNNAWAIENLPKGVEFSDEIFWRIDLPKANEFYVKLITLLDRYDMEYCLLDSKTEIDIAFGPYSKR